jgi:hypothetical protein
MTGNSPYPASGEHAPLSGVDEFLVHNAPYPVRVMWTPDAQAYERVWFTCQDRVGELLVVIGLAFYPNLGTSEAFAIVNLRGRHTTVRAHRSLLGDRMDMTLGPFRFDVEDPFRRWRLRLDTDSQPDVTGSPALSFDIAWLDTKRPVFRQLGAGLIVGDRALSPVAGYDGFGRQEGWVQVGDERFELSPASHLGTRDHHWGTRDGVGGPGSLHGDATSAQRGVGRVRGLRRLGRPRPVQPRRPPQEERHPRPARAPHALRARHASPRGR